MKHIVAYSTGKDSTALALWAAERFPASDIILLFDDTLWEHPSTYEYLGQMKERIIPGAQFVRLVSSRFPGGMEELVQVKKRVPSSKARFCTSALKVEPTIEFLRTIEDEYELYDGRRAQESASRAALPVREWSDDYDCWVNHPILHWTAEQCFEISKRYGIPNNPLYTKGAGRVGCFPCVMINLRELKAFLSDPELGPELKTRIRRLEDICGRTFFPPNYIPDRFKTGFDPKSGKAICLSGDVFSYVESVDADQLPLLPPRSCMSIYNLCET